MNFQKRFSPAGLSLVFSGIEFWIKRAKVWIFKKIINGSKYESKLYLTWTRICQTLVEKWSQNPHPLDHQDKIWRNDCWLPIPFERKFTRIIKNLSKFVEYVPCSLHRSKFKHPILNLSMNLPSEIWCLGWTAYLKLFFLRIKILNCK